MPDCFLLKPIVLTYPYIYILMPRLCSCDILVPPLPFKVLKSVYQKGEEVMTKKKKKTESVLKSLSCRIWRIIFLVLILLYFFLFLINLFIQKLIIVVNHSFKGSHV